MLPADAVAEAQLQVFKDAPAAVEATNNIVPSPLAPAPPTLEAAAAAVVVEQPATPASQPEAAKKQKEVKQQVQEAPASSSAPEEDEKKAKRQRKRAASKAKAARKHIAPKDQDLMRCVPPMIACLLTSGRARQGRRSMPLGPWSVGREIVWLAGLPPSPATTHNPAPRILSSSHRLPLSCPAPAPPPSSQVVR